MGKHRYRTCDLGDCFANRNDRCKLLDESIEKDCPFYKVGKMDMERYADIKAYRYAIAREAEIRKTCEEKHEAFRKARAEYYAECERLEETKSAKKLMKRRIKKRLGLLKT